MKGTTGSKRTLDFAGQHFHTQQVKRPLEVAEMDKDANRLGHLLFSLPGGGYIAKAP